MSTASPIGVSRPAPTTTAPFEDRYDSAPGAKPEIHIARADSVQGRVGLYDVTVDGVTHRMDKQAAEDLLHVLQPLPEDAIDAPVQVPKGQALVGQVGAYVVTTSLSQLPMKPPGTPKVVQGSLDPMSAASTMEYAGRTGHVPTGLTKGSLANIDEMTLLAHAGPSTVNIEGVRMAPSQLADKLIESGWSGGKLTLVACDTGLGGSSSYAQALADALLARGARTTVIAPSGMAGILGADHGMPQLFKKLDADGVPQYEKAGDGWRAYTGEAPEGWHVDRSALRPGAWKGVAMGAAESAAFIGLGILHNRAVVERTRQETEKTGWSAPGPTGHKAYDIGAFILDPGDDASRSIPLGQRFDMPRWRQTMVEAANHKQAGEYYKCSWTTSDGHDLTGEPRYRTFDATYRKMPDGRWRTESSKGCKDGELPPDLNKIIDPKVSDAELRQYLELPQANGGIV